MNSALGNFAKEKYLNSKSDLFAMFIERSFELAHRNGFLALVTMESWMFLSSYENFRKGMLNKTTIQTMVHMPYLGRGGTSMGINFGTSATVWLKRSIPNYAGKFQCIRYYECDDGGIPKQFPTINEKTASAAATDLQKMPGGVIAYWVSDRVRDNFINFPPLVSIAKPRQGATTSDNNRFLRFWFEVNLPSVKFNSTSLEEAEESDARWFPYNKGGAFRKWHGNHDYVINYWNDGADIKAFHDELNKTNPGGRLKNQDCYFHECASWSKVSSGQFSVRHFPSGFIFARS